MSLRGDAHPTSARTFAWSASSASIIASTERAPAWVVFSFQRRAWNSMVARSGSGALATRSRKEIS